MDIEILPVGSLGANCYILNCKTTKEGVVIDPGDEGERILDVINDKNINIKYIINTHGHYDHIGSNEEIKKALNCDLLVHEDDYEMLIDPKLNLSFYMGNTKEGLKADVSLKDNDLIKFGNLGLKVLHTPGHSPGGICLYNEKNKICITGDTLFYGSIGRTDFEGGDYEEIIKSIKEKLLVLPDDVTIYPGHGPKSSIGLEKQINLYIK
ncbi:Glyoxylase, beta-lactamase superfamily II [Desulfonispora thiosulfatigenes DSM 11270]|uniref:Glyoxylase, beta-lactamase superfamily II n=1 Tax=Desulfonispora thiosulfatigenes DSM 11270 TaxID=656914 RepID=A0A1W1VQM9_DESTI|nr:MBL fold metallo-hydrolase [Desulfonispora thiosulfatigenes]SMB95675.1 Glyoxylase, beta-lactamase superfamily II [Desulfonispora thiosulfatigenes DSM 11270]